MENNKLNDLKKEIKEIKAIVQNTQQIINELVEEKYKTKIDYLKNKLNEIESISINEIIFALGVSRQGALNIMKRAEDENFKFIVGDSQTPSCMINRKRQNLLKFKFVENLIESQGSCSWIDIKMNRGQITDSLEALKFAIEFKKYMGEDYKIVSKFITNPLTGKEEERLLKITRR